MKNNYNPLDCECKITALLLNIAQKKTVSDETALYFDIGQKMLIRALDLQALPCVGRSCFRSKLKA